MIIPNAPEYEPEMKHFAPLKKNITMEHYKLKQERFERMYKLRLPLDNFFNQEEQEYFSKKLLKGHTSEDINYWILKNGSPEEIEKENAKQIITHFGGYWRKEQEYQSFKNAYIKWVQTRTQNESTTIFDDVFINKPEFRQEDLMVTFELAKQKFQDWIRTEDHFIDAECIYSEYVYDIEEEHKEKERIDQAKTKPKRKTSVKKTNK
jgi:hypothetical protein